MNERDLTRFEQWYYNVDISDERIAKNLTHRIGRFVWEAARKEAIEECIRIVERLFGDSINEAESLLYSANPEDWNKAYAMKLNSLGVLHARQKLIEDQQHDQETKNE